jgi:DNA polymerase I-like protein with 3'-5' exonuclease and polymerase domains
MINIEALKQEKAIGFDTETYCPHIKKFGTSVKRGGYICGISLATKDNAWYFPTKYYAGGELIDNSKPVYDWLRDFADVYEGTIVGTNLQYDLLYLKQENIEFNRAKFYDISLADCLINENQKSYSLEALGNKYLNVGKTDEELYAYLADKHGGKPIRKQQAGKIYLAPPDIVAPYAKDDAALPLKIKEHQLAEIQRQDLGRVTKLEMDLLPILVKMRWNGIRVDLEHAENVYAELSKEICKIEIQLMTYGLFLDDINIKPKLYDAFMRQGLEIKYTKMGNLSFTKNWLATHPHPLCKLIVKARKLIHYRDVFIKSYILDSHIDGRVHCQFNQLKDENFGATSGRLSASYPNLQNVPSRDQEYSAMIRKCFLPEENEYYIKADYDQVEFRLFVHYSRSKRLINKYEENPYIDFHDEVTEILFNVIRRKIMKNFNFMKLFGGGKSRTTAMLEAELDETAIQQLLEKLCGGEVKTENPYEVAAMKFIEIYDNKFPEASSALNEAKKLAEMYGYIKTISGRRIRFDLWEPRYIEDYENRPKALPYDQAEREYGPQIKRAFTYKALNAECQGSSADIIKKAMVVLYKEYGYVPLLTVHDELGKSSSDPVKDSKILKDVMENVVKLRVPLLVSCDVEETWK